MQQMDFRTILHQKFPLSGRDNSYIFNKLALSFYQYGIFSSTLSTIFFSTATRARLKAKSRVLPVGNGLVTGLQIQIVQWTVTVSFMLLNNDFNSKYNDVMVMMMMTLMKVEAAATGYQEYEYKNDCKDHVESEGGKTTI